MPDNEHGPTRGEKRALALFLVGLVFLLAWGALAASRGSTGPEPRPGETAWLAARCAEAGGYWAAVPDPASPGTLHQCLREPQGR